MMHLKTVLDRFIGQSDDWRVRLIHLWPTIMGALHKRVQIQKIIGSTLFLGVHDSAWIAELHMLSRLIIKNINSKLEAPRITLIRLQLSTARPRPVTAAPKTAPPVQAQKPQPTPRHEAALGRVKDPQLQEALRTFFDRCVPARRP